VSSSPETESPLSRRPLEVRKSRWAVAVARWLTAHNIQPNTISVAGIAFSVAAAIAFVSGGRSDSTAIQVACLLLAAIGIQVRLLCNLFDGMVAIEGGKSTKSGELYNEIPDRFSDAFSLVAAGYYVSAQPWVADVGWLAAALAITTAYVRALGASTGAGQHFEGPMAKPQRMALLTVACIAEAMIVSTSWHGWVITISLVIICVGCLLTIIRRARNIAISLEGAQFLADQTNAESAHHGGA
jgi:phosphatidylglycerophosphate synthase